MKAIAYVSHYLCLAFLCICLAGCTKQAPDHAAVQKQFDDYTNEIFMEEMTKNTINLHYTLARPEDFGFTDYPVTLGQYSVAYFEEVYADLAEMQSTLSAFDPLLLTDSQQLTYALLQDYIETELSMKDYYLFSEVLSPTTGYQAQLPVLLAEYTFRTRQDIENYLTLLSQIDDLYADIIIFEQEKSKAGLFMPDYAVDAILEQCEEFICDPDNNYMIEVFNDKIHSLSGLSEEEKNSYIERNHHLITTEVVDGYQLLIDGLSALKGTGTNELGLCYYEHGKEYYQYLVRTSTGSAASVKKLQKLTRNFIQEALKEMFAIMSADPQALETIDTYSFSITQPEAILEDLIQKISADFPEPPKVSYTVKYVHPSMEDHLSPAFYLTPPIDDIKNNVIYINNKYADDDIYPTIAHEGYPGHLYQTVYTSTCGLPLIRSILSHPGYTEGWATYTEYYSYRISGLDTAVADILQLNSAASLGLYAYIDMGIHYDGWNRENVRSYLADYGITDAETANDIFETMVEEPANYLSYFIGYLELITLRDDAQKALGDAFTLKDFHNFLLETGPAPFDIIRTEMKSWIAGQQK